MKKEVRGESGMQEGDVSGSKEEGRGEEDKGK